MKSEVAVLPSHAAVATVRSLVLDQHALLLNILLPARLLQAKQLLHKQLIRVLLAPTASHMCANIENETFC